MENSLENAQTKRKLSLEEKRIVKSFENIPFERLVDRARLILVWRKLKQATDFVFNTPVDDLQLKNIKSIIEKAGLFFKCEVKEGESRQACFVADNQNDLELVLKLWSSTTLYDRDVQFGRLFGFPQTAIEAYDKNSVDSKAGKKSKYLLTLDEMDEKVPKDLIPYCLLMLSRANWEQELKTVKRWADEIKLVDPALYKAISNQL
ncbi:MAG TPA: hypothetical protein VK675_01130 [Candidatus Paceibacterota bacterium]|nr:hypothetical protein [Candidatus Paceibacterota bacterium]